jgi:tetratricopeptide (TPR) repeat protein
MRITNRHEFARISTNKIAILFALLGAILSPSRAAVAQTTQESLSSLRLALAMDYGNPNSHLVFAKALRENGDPLTAFLICEHARTLFGEDAFLSSFDIVFRGHITDVLFHARKQVLQAAINLAPKSVEPLKELADLYAAHGEPADAVTVLKRAMDIAPEDVRIVASLQLNLEAAGQKDNAETFLSNWCQDHPDAPLAWERRVKEAIDRNDDSASQLLDQAITKFPDDGQLLLMRAQVEEQQHPDDAQADYVSAARLAKYSARAQGAAGRFFIKIHHDPERAVDYYVAAYFLDPDFNDWESAAQRIREASGELARTQIAEAKAIESDDMLESLVTGSNPLVAAAAIATNTSEIGGTSDAMVARHEKNILSMVASACPEVRVAAIDQDYQSDQAIRERLQKLLSDQDPWARAAAASMVSETAMLTPLLHDPSTLVRLHAATALLKGTDSAGRAAVVEAMKTEPSQWLRKLIADALAQGSQWRNPEMLENADVGPDR